MTLTPQELSRFSRHILLPEVGAAGQEKLKSASVLIIGTGGLGSPVSLYLAAAGVGRLGLVEFDQVDRSNLQRQILYSDSDVGRPKIEAAAERLESLHPAVNLQIFHEPFSAENAERIARDFDVVIDGTDNFSTRYLVNDICVKLKKPSIYGSVFRFEGQASVFKHGGPCYRCVFPSPPPPEEVPSCAEGGVLGVLPGTIGLLQATETLKLILGIGESLAGRLLIFDALSMRFDEFAVAKDPKCPACGERKVTTSHLVPNQSCEIPDQSVPSINVRDYKALRDSGEKHTLLDVRTQGETEVSKINGSIHIPVAELPSRLSEIDRQLPIVVHCKSGGRSSKAATLLIENGFKNVLNLAGGILAWSAEIDPSLPKY